MTFAGRHEVVEQRAELDPVGLDEVTQLDRGGRAGSMRPRGCPGPQPASTVLKLDRSLAKLRSALSEAICPFRTVLLSRMSAVVTSKLALAVSMNELPESMSRCRSSPVPANAVGELVHRGLQGVRSTDSTVVDDVGQQGLGRRSGSRVSATTISESVLEVGLRRRSAAGARRTAHRRRSRCRSARWSRRGCRRGRSRS